MEPPPPATVALAQVHRVPRGLRLRRVVPRYQSPAALPTRAMPIVNGRQECLPHDQPCLREPPAVRHCILCGAALPPWRDICAAHAARGGRGMPPPVRLQPLTAPPADAPVRRGSDIISLGSTSARD